MLCDYFVCIVLLPIKQYRLKPPYSTATRLRPGAGLALVFRASSHTHAVFLTRTSVIKTLPTSMQQLLVAATASTALVVVDGPGCFDVNGVGDPQLDALHLWISHSSPAASRQGDVSLTCKYYLRSQAKHTTQFTLTNTRTNDSNTLQTYTTLRRNTFYNNHATNKLT